MIVCHAVITHMSYDICQMLILILGTGCLCSKRKSHWLWVKIAIFLMSPRSICLGAINTAPGLQGGIACSKRTNLHILTSDLRLFVYFGKSGIHAFDLDGKKLWSKSLGTGSTRRKWGSAASPVMVGKTLVVSAAEEALSVFGLDPETGKEKWKAEGASLEMAYATPAVMKSKEGRVDLVLPVPGEIWGINPESGRLRWYAPTAITGNISPSPVIGEGTVYVFGGYPRLVRTAVRIEGAKGEIGQERVLWEDNQSTYVPTPVLVGGRLYWASDQGYACCADAKSGKLLFKERLDARGKGSRGKPFYAAAVAVAGNIFAVSRWGGTFVFAAGSEFKLLAHNRINDDDSQFHGTPAISNGQLFLRSDKYLYCISK